MNLLKQHMKTHGAIHALWFIAVLIFIIAALILMTPNGESVGNYIAFATSIASLVLAVVAIGQALISNQSFSETIGSLKASTHSFEAAAQNIADTSSLLNAQSERIIGEAERFPNVVQELSAKMDERLPKRDSKITDALPNSKSDASSEALKVYDKTTFGASLALYIVCLASIRGKPIDLRVMFDDASGGLVWRTSTNSYITALRDLQPFGIKIERTKNDDERKFSYVISSIGDWPAAEIVKQFANYDDKEGNHERAMVDKYFFGQETPPEMGVSPQTDAVSAQPSA